MSLNANISSLYSLAPEQRSLDIRSTSIDHRYEQHRAPQGQGPPIRWSKPDVVCRYRFKERSQG